jgi:predicted membrane-bound mannosyltransferase
VGTKRAGGVIAILLVGAILRFAYLDADPDYYAWAGYITDEGRWVKHARDLVLFRQAAELDWAAHVHVAPLFHVAHVAVFKLVGVSLLTARLLTAVSGVALLLTVWLLLRRVVTPAALVAALALLAFDVDLVMLSRVSIPEMAALWLEMVAYYILVAAPATPTRMAMAGFCLFLAVATKATVLPTLLIFSALVLVAGIWDSRRPSPRHLLALGGGRMCSAAGGGDIAWLAAG